MMFAKRLFLIILWASIDFNEARRLDPEGENVCSKLNDDETRTLHYPGHYLSHSRIDLLMPKEYFCCPGYEEENGECKPLCADGCLPGKCNAPNQCEECAINFGGQNCNQTCLPGTFGINCEFDCEYLLDPKRNQNYTQCECKSNKIASECKNICKCRSNLCHLGYFGKKCDIPCTEGTFGQHCSKNCTCIKENTLGCNIESGDCRCKNDAIDQYYGLNCEFKCIGMLKCLNNSTHNCTCEVTLEQKIDYLIKNQTLQEQKLNEIELLKKRINDLSLILLYFMIIGPLLFIIYKLRNQKFVKITNLITVGYSNRMNNLTKNSITRDKQKSDLNNSQFESHLIMPEQVSQQSDDSSSDDQEELFTKKG